MKRRRKSTYSHHAHKPTWGVYLTATDISMLATAILMKGLSEKAVFTCARTLCRVHCQWFLTEGAGHVPGPALVMVLAPSDERCQRRLCLSSGKAGIKGVPGKREPSTGGKRFPSSLSQQKVACNECRDLVSLDGNCRVTRTSKHGPGVCTGSGSRPETRILISRTTPEPARPV